MTAATMTDAKTVTANTALLTPDTEDPLVIAYQITDGKTVYYVMQFAGNINNFGAVFFLTGGGPALPDTISTQAGATDLLISWIYKLTYNTPNMYNMASVLSILVFIVLVPFAVYQFTRTKSFKDGEI